MAPGGHCDANPDVWASAEREAEEETGLKNLKPLGEGIFDLNVGGVPTRQKPHGIEPAHIHFDVCFAFEAPNNAELIISEESSDLKWIEIATIIDTLNYFDGHKNRITKTRMGNLT